MSSTNKKGKEELVEVKEAEYESNARGEYLVLQILSNGLKKTIPVEEVGKWACDHDYLVSDCGRCWDCGEVKQNRQPPMNWTLSKI